MRLYGRMCIWLSGNATAMKRVGLAGVAALAHLGPRPRRARRAMVAVGNIQRGNAREGVHQLGGLLAADPPDRVMHAIVGAEVVERRIGGDRAAQPIDLVRRPVGQEDDARLRARAR